MVLAGLLLRLLPCASLLSRYQVFLMHGQFLSSALCFRAFVFTWNLFHTKKNMNKYMQYSYFSILALYIKLPSQIMSFRYCYNFGP